jgi:hypothetical protein
MFLVVRAPSSLVFMQESPDLALWGSCLREIGHRSRVFEEFPLDFSRESTPSHDDGRSQTFQDSLVFAGGLIGLPTCRRVAHLPEARKVFDTLTSVLLRADTKAPPTSSNRAIAAAQWLISV